MNIIVACFPKSGSSYFTNLLSAVRGAELRWLMYHTADDSPQTLYEPWIESIRGKETVTQQHLTASDGNILLIKKHNLRTVVHVRNIFDTLISYYDHIEQHKQQVLTGYIPKTYFSMTREEKLSFLVAMHFPFYFHFYASWLEAQREVPVLWTTYEEMVTDQVGLVQRTFEFYDLKYSPDQIRAAFPKVDMGKARFNKGVVGRGATVPDEQKNELRRMARLHKLPDDAFKLIGLA